MERVGEHPVPAGPLAVRWLAYELDPPRAGAVTRARVAFENAGSAAWRRDSVKLAYHWLDERGNAIDWDGFRTDLPFTVEPGASVEVDAHVRAALPPGPYVFAFDLVDEHRIWFAEAGNVPLELKADVEPRIERALAAVGGDERALAEQEEPLVSTGEAAAVAYLADDAAPAPDWSRLVLDRHQEGYALVGGAIESEGGWLLRRRGRALEAWRAEQGRVPAFAHPLLCPSVVADVEPVWEEPVEGLPAARAPEWEPVLFDGRIRVALRARRARFGPS